ncbi:MAG TPA: hypothetical protein DEO38_01090 [Bacteroidales bacterium]|nr:hypothetical protein [Bacteroidales bacterium]
MNRLLSFLLTTTFFFTCCRTDEQLITPDTYDLAPARDISTFADDEPTAFYVINQGNMGSNKATIDHGSFISGKYLRNIFAERNPNVVKELGDVGNDIKIYRNRLYAVINASHKVEVMDLEAHRIGQIDIPNCRYITFHNDKAYVTSFVGEVADFDAPLGAVYVVDINSMEITTTITVGYQPEEMVIDNGMLYVANSGGYSGYDDPQKYEQTISVIDLATNQVVKTLDTGKKNLTRLRIDNHGQLWVMSNGDYISSQPTLLVSNSDKTSFTNLNIPCSNFTISGDKVYYYHQTSGNKTYGVIDVTTRSVISTSLITDGTEQTITMPYMIDVNNYSGDIYIGDAKNYVSSGTLSCYTSGGTLRWRVTTGDIPAAMAFIYKEQEL